MTIDVRDGRKRDLALIHMAKKQLGLDDETYRAILIRETGHHSAKAMTEAQRRRVLECFIRSGFTMGFAPSDNRAERGRGRRGNAANAVHSKIRYLWRDLYRAKAIDDNTDAALDAFVRRMTGIASLRWLNAVRSRSVLESLKSWLRRLEGSRDQDKVAGGSPE